MHPMSDAVLQAQIDGLKSEVSSLRQLLQQAQKALEDSRQENTILRQKLDALARRYFGKKSEQLDATQLMLLLNGVSETVVEAPAPQAKQLPLIFPRKEGAAKTQRIRVPDNLEVVTEVIEPEVVQ